MIITNLHLLTLISVQVNMHGPNRDIKIGIISSFLNRFLQIKAHFELQISIQYALFDRCML